MGERMKGGAVSEERSPEKEAMLIRDTRVEYQRYVQVDDRGMMLLSSWRKGEGGRWTHDLRKVAQLLFCAEGTPCGEKQQRSQQFRGRMRRGGERKAKPKKENTKK